MKGEAVDRYMRYNEVYVADLRAVFVGLEFVENVYLGLFVKW